MVDEITILIRHRALTVMEIIDELTANSHMLGLLLHKADQELFRGFISLCMGKCS